MSSHMHNLRVLAANLMILFWIVLLLIKFAKLILVRRTLKKRVILLDYSIPAPTIIPRGPRIPRRSGYVAEDSDSSMGDVPGRVSPRGGSRRFYRNRVVKEIELGLDMLNMKVYASPSPSRPMEGGSDTMWEARRASFPGGGSAKWQDEEGSGTINKLHQLVHSPTETEGGGAFYGVGSEVQSVAPRASAQFFFGVPHSSLTRMLNRHKGKGSRRHRLKLQQENPNEISDSGELIEQDPSKSQLMDQFRAYCQAEGVLSGEGNIVIEPYAAAPRHLAQRLFRALRCTDSDLPRWWFFSEKKDGPVLDQSLLGSCGFQCPALAPPREPRNLLSNPPHPGGKAEEAPSPAGAEAGKGGKSARGKLPPSESLEPGEAAGGEGAEGGADVPMALYTYPLIAIHSWRPEWSGGRQRKRSRVACRAVTVCSFENKLPEPEGSSAQVGEQSTSTCMRGIEEEGQNMSPSQTTPSEPASEALGPKVMGAVERKYFFTQDDEAYELFGVFAEAEEEEDGCCICTAAPPSTIALPCRHMSTCRDCLILHLRSSDGTCPICRVTIEASISREPEGAGGEGRGGVEGDDS